MNNEVIYDRRISIWPLSGLLHRVAKLFAVFFLSHCRIVLSLNVLIKIFQSHHLVFFKIKITKKGRNLLFVHKQIGRCGMIAFCEVNQKDWKHFKASMWIQHRSSEFESGPVTIFRNRIDNIALVLFQTSNLPSSCRSLCSTFNRPISCQSATTNHHLAIYDPSPNHRKDLEQA